MLTVHPPAFPQQPSLVDPPAAAGSLQTEASAGHLDRVLSLIESGEDVNQRDVR